MVPKSMIIIDCVRCSNKRLRVLWRAIQLIHPELQVQPWLRVASDPSGSLNLSPLLWFSFQQIINPSRAICGPRRLIKNTFTCSDKHYVSLCNSLYWKHTYRSAALLSRHARQLHSLPSEHSHANIQRRCAPGLKPLNKVTIIHRNHSASLATVC